MKVTPHVHDNIRSLFSSGRCIFPVVDKAQSSKVVQNSPVIEVVYGKKEYRKLLKFFFDSYARGKNKYEKIEGFISKKIMMFLSSFTYDSRNDILEVIKFKDKILACYALSVKEGSSELNVNYMALAPGQKNTKMAVCSLLNIAKRISEIAKLHRKKNIVWDVDLNNESAKVLYDNIPKNSFRYVGNGFGRYTIRVSDFEKALNQNLR